MGWSDPWVGVASGVTGEHRRIWINFSRVHFRNMDEVATRTPGWERTERVEILFVCTANQCRSPVAEAALRARLGEAEADVAVRSGGLRWAGGAAPHEVEIAALANGLDLRDHVSRSVTTAELETVDLLIGMTRAHVRECVVMFPPVWPKAFTLKELVRRGLVAGPRGESQDLGEWVSELHANRRRAELMDLSSVDDLQDPIGGPLPAYEAMTEEIIDLVDQLTSTVWPG